MQTDNVDGFLLDRGFQIFLTSYKEAQAMLDYQSLDLQPFYAGEPAVYATCAGQNIGGQLCALYSALLSWASSKTAHMQGLW